MATNAKEDVKKIAVGAGATIGSAAGVGVVAAGASSVAATTAAAAAAAAPFASTPLFASFAAAQVGNPAAWALAVSNPVGATIVVSAAVAVGAYASFKLISKLLD